MGTALAGKEEIFHHLLRTAATKMRPEIEYYLQPALKGNDYAGDLFFCGRAANGWADGFTADDARNDSARTAIIERAVAFQRDGICEFDGGFRNDVPCSRDPLHWVHHLRNDGTTTDRSSPYWRVVGKTAQAIGGSARQDNWSSGIACSNLYKVSRMTGRNPPPGLLTAQFPVAVDLLRCELMEYRPKWAIFLTEVDAKHGWFRWFGEPLGFEEERRSLFQYVSSIGKLRLSGLGVNTIVAEHPQARKEDVFVDSLLRSIANEPSKS